MRRARALYRADLRSGGPSIYGNGLGGEPADSRGKAVERGPAVALHEDILVQSYGAIPPACRPTSNLTSASSRAIP